MTGLSENDKRLKAIAEKRNFDAAWIDNPNTGLGYRVVWGGESWGVGDTPDLAKAQFEGILTGLKVRLSADDKAAIHQIRVIK